MKAVFFDLDDTLLNSKKQISDRNQKAIWYCKNQGMLVGYITTRSPRKMQEYLKDLPCDCIAHYNGAMIYADGTLIAKNNIPYRDAVPFLEQIRLEDPDIDISYYCEPYNYRHHQLQNTLTGEIYPDRKVPAEEVEFQRIRIVLDQMRPGEFEKYCSPSMQTQITVHKTSIITSVNATKKRALETLMEYYSLDARNVVSFGDDLNDIGMLIASGTGVAMGNALPEVKEAADYVTGTNDEDGVGEYIEQFL